MRKLLISLITFGAISLVPATAVLADDTQMRLTAGLSYTHTLTATEQEQVSSLFFTQDMAAYTDTEDDALYFFDLPATVSPAQLVRLLQTLAGNHGIEITFDATRSVTGRAASDTRLRVYTGNADSFFAVSDIITGSSGVFSIDIELQEGENLIALVFEKDETTVIVVSSIRRMSEEVKLELGNSAGLLPGLNNRLFGDH